MFFLGVIDFDDNWSFRYVLPERLVRFMLNKLDLTYSMIALTCCQTYTLMVFCLL